MKILLLTVCLVFFTSASAQVYQKSKPQSYTIDLLKQSNITNNFFNRNNDTLFLKILNHKTQQTLLPGINYLPIDNMPCIVPLTPSLGFIPNAAKNVETMQLGKMPNGGIQKPFTFPLLKKD